MKAVLISIRPEWCEKIASGQKTIEVRKTKPKLNAPFKCYIYCTKNGGEHKKIYNSYNVCVDFETAFACGMVIGEFICDEVKLYKPEESPSIWHEMMQRSCLSGQEIADYTGGNHFFGWHISGLVIYDKPKELSCFLSEKYATTGCPILGKMDRPPRSWCYVEELEDAK